MNILGISAYYHDSAACMLRDGEIVAAVQEERFSREKGDASLPVQSIAYCLQAGGIRAADLDLVGFYEKPVAHFDRILETFFAVAPGGVRPFLKAIPVWITERLHLKRKIREALPGFRGRLLFAGHHESHAASAFFPSPYPEAAFLTMDGVGEWTTASYGIGSGNRLKFRGRIQFPHSLGMLYSAFTYYTGFKVNSGEYKVMGLAPYGEPKYAPLILEKLIELGEDGSFRLNMDYFQFHRGLTMVNERFCKLFGGPPREPESPLTQKEMDLAASIQSVCEEVMLRMARQVHRDTGMEALCLAGGVALNCVGNGRILREVPFKHIWIQPAAGDAGGALGVALSLWHQYCDGPRLRSAPGGDPGAREQDAQKGSYVGPEFSAEEIQGFMDSAGAVYERLDQDTLLDRTAQALVEERIVGWFQGRMEFGPRALGNRSILGDPRSPAMQKEMNLKIKFREGFRPFAPSVLRERLGDYFELDRDSPYMLLVAPVRKDLCLAESEQARKAWGIDRLNHPRSSIPAVTHIDYSARIQTVHQDTNPLYWGMLKRFEQKTGCGLVVNTSFNVRGEPIVCTPKDAYTCFMRTGLDVLVMGPYYLRKQDQPPLKEDIDWRLQYQLD